MAHPDVPVKLKKELGLFDVYAISTGAMFSSGFFLLPGLAAAQTGPSVALAYLVAGIFILPAMFSMAELSTAMPRAGGAYYFLDRSLGPMVGTVGGLGTWLSLVLKSAFALVGMGAYLALFVEVPMKPLAVGFTILFAVVNIVGAKETGGLQRALVSALVLIMSFFIIQGLVEVFSNGIVATTQTRFTPFFAFGFSGFMGTVGFVFVSYAGLTKVASVSEEVRNPDRNIPLGMILSLITAAFVYAVGVYIIVAVLDPGELRSDLTPVATAAAAFFDWLPGSAGVILIVIAAVAAFASTGNAGILSASRYPLAMARDQLIAGKFGEIGRFGTPTIAVITTAAAMIFCIVALDIEAIAKLASAFQLLLFALLSLAVVIMRESRIEGYDPGYRSPLYPWMQLFGMLAPFWLISEMGEMAVLFTLAMIAGCVGWYFYYGRHHVERSGAIYHTFAQLGRHRYAGLDLELRGIAKERGLRPQDPFDQVVARAEVLDISGATTFRDVAKTAAEILSRQSGVPVEPVFADFMRELELEMVPVAGGAALPHARVTTASRPEMVIVRCREGIALKATAEGEGPGDQRVHAVFFLLSPENEPGQHLRLLGHLATHVDDDAFLPAWLEAADGNDLKETLLREERMILLEVSADSGTASWAGKPIKAVDLAPGTLIALIRRNGQAIVPQGSTVLAQGDRLTVIGERDDLRKLTDNVARSD